MKCKLQLTLYPQNKLNEHSISELSIINYQIINKRWEFEPGELSANYGSSRVGVNSLFNPYPATTKSD